MTLKECFAVLGLEPKASLDDVKRAYRRKAFELHPDLNPTVPDAGRQFQLLNESYVILVKVLETTQAQKTAPPQDEKQSTYSRAKKSAQEDPKAKKTEAGSKTHNSADAATEQGGQGNGADKTQQSGTNGAQQAEQQSQEQAGAENSARQQAKPPHSDESQNAKAEQPSQKQRERAESAYTEREDVLKNLLDDPFARRVYEDIYREVHKHKQADEKPTVKAEKAPVTSLEKPRMRLGSELGKSVGGVVKTWLKQQIDEELEVFLPAHTIFPGARVRLQIRQGLSQELRTVEVTLPADIICGGVIRLKGMGRKVGRWQGDLYLRISAKNQGSAP